MTLLFQDRVLPWMLECFGHDVSMDRVERNHRFIEEALELVQALGCTRSEAHQLVDYVFDRPAGEPAQEAGGTVVTLAALCIANDLCMHEAAETELARIWTKIDAIRAKQATKPKHSPLPGSTIEVRADARLVEIVTAAADRVRGRMGAAFRASPDSPGFRINPDSPYPGDALHFVDVQTGPKASVDALLRIVDVEDGA